MRKEVVEFKSRDIYIEEPCTGGTHKVPLEIIELGLNSGEYINIIFGEYDCEESSNSEININLWRVSKFSIIDEFKDIELDKEGTWPESEYLDKNEYYDLVDNGVDIYNTLSDEEGWDEL